MRSEGVGVVVLKPLAAALADGDQVYATIIATGLNHDGDTSPYMQPSGKGQEALLRQVYERAGIAPADVHYVEAHGTGTSVGDPIEVKALAAVLGQDRPMERPLWVGSVKSNIGHCEGAAGVAGLLKAALAIRYRTLPRVLHFKSPNPHVPWADLPVQVVAETMRWPTEEPAVAGVNSFGISGINAHVVLREAPAPDRSGTGAPERTGIGDPTVAGIGNPAAAGTTETSGFWLLPISAHTPETLLASARSWSAFAAADSPDGATLDEICATAARRRTHQSHRLALTIHSRAEIGEALGAFLAGEEHPGLARGIVSSGARPKTAFVFSGHGSQWIGMGRQLLAAEPVFREALERCELALAPHTDWSLMEQLQASAEHSRLAELDVVQPTLFALQVAFAALWRSWGVVPDAVVGHSMGEVAAAHVAGILTLEDAARIIAIRSHLMKCTSGKGMMAAVDLTIDEARLQIGNRTDKVSVAVCNGPNSTVVSGDPTAVGAILAELEADAIFCRPVKVDVASHSPQMDPLRDELLAELGVIRPRTGSVPFYSTAVPEFGHRMEDGPTMDASYWWKNLRNCVLFGPAVERLIGAGHLTFVEMSPHPLLTQAIAQELNLHGKTGVAVPSQRRDEPERPVMLRSLGQLWAVGCTVDWQRLLPGEARCVQLPLPAWQRERFWYQPEGAGRASRSGEQTQRRGIGVLGRSLLGRRLSSAADPGLDFWELELGTKQFPHLGDHRVEGTAVLPGAGYVDIAMGAAVEAFGPGRHRIEDVSFQKALFLADEPRTVQLVMQRETPEVAAFKFLVPRTAALTNPEHHRPGACCVPGRSPSARPRKRSNPGTNVQRLLPRHKLAAPHFPFRLRANASYLITGGLGDLGLLTARWLAEKGVHRLVLLGRTPLPPRESWSKLPADHPQSGRIAQILEIEAIGTSVRVEAVDIGNERQLNHFFKRFHDEGWPPIRGIVHTAGLLQDRTLNQMEAADIDAVFRPKVFGTWLLLRHIAPRDLDFFVAFSSAASVLGMPGLANYSAANAFLDAIAHDRRHLGHMALAINWGPWSDVGLAAKREDRGGRLAEMGMSSFTPAEGINVLERLLNQDAPQMAVMPVDWDRWFQSNPLAARSKTLARVTQDDHVATPKAVSKPGLDRDGLLASAPEQREALLLDYLREALGKTIRLPASGLDVDKAINRMGLDSLMAVNLKSRIDADLGLKIAATKLLEGPTLRQLAQTLAAQAAAPVQAAMPAPTATGGLHADGKLDAAIVPAAIAAGPTLGRVLLTGATGFLGAYLLEELLARTDAELICLVRASDRDHARERLALKLAELGLGTPDQAARVIALPGDLALPRFGLAEAEFEELAGSVDAIYHCGALVNFLLPYGELKATNVQGTVEILRLACLRRAVPVHYVSSVSAQCSRSNAGRVVSEEDLPASPDDLQLGYAQSKWVAEHLVREAIGRGLPATIFRPAFIGWDTRTGIFSHDNLALSLLAASMALGSAPDLEMSVDWVPPDFAARAIVGLSLSPRSHNRTFHLVSPDPKGWDTLLDGLRAMGVPLESMPWENGITCEPTTRQKSPSTASCR